MFSADEENQADTAAADDGLGPKGKWKKGTCSWTEIMCRPMCLMGFCCDQLLLAQVMTRMGLDYCGKPDPGNAPGTFSIMILVTICFYLSFLLVGLGVLFIIPIQIYLICACTRTRAAVREKFEIAPEYFDANDGCIEDCCCGLVCPCCTAIQMARKLIPGLCFLPAFCTVQVLIFLFVPNRTNTWRRPISLPIWWTGRITTKLARALSTCSSWKGIKTGTTIRYPYINSMRGLCLVAFL